MIELRVEAYCQDCLDFAADVKKPERLLADEACVILGNTIVRCEYAKRCSNLKRYLEQRLRKEDDK